MWLDFLFLRLELLWDIEWRKSVPENILLELRGFNLVLESLGQKHDLWRINSDRVDCTRHNHVVKVLIKALKFRDLMVLGRE